MKIWSRIQKSKLYGMILNNKRKAAVASILVIIGTQVLNEGTASSFNRLQDKLQGVEIQEGIITPIYQYDAMEQPEMVKEYSKKFGAEILERGFILNLFLHNEKTSPVSIAETSVVVDEIKKIEEPKVYVLAKHREEDNIFSIYILNNDLGEFSKGTVRVTGFCDSSCIKGQKEMTEEEITKAVFSLQEGENIDIPVSSVKGGEIRKIADHTIDLSLFEPYTNITLKYEILDEKNQCIQGDYIGFLTEVDGSPKYAYTAGEGEDLQVHRTVLVDTENDMGKELKLPGSFKMESENVQNVLYTILPTSSCVLTFHVNVKCAGESKKLTSQQYIQRVFVPLYREQGRFWYDVRNFLEKYEMDIYEYNSNPILQKEIAYRPEDYLTES